MRSSEKGSSLFLPDYYPLTLKIFKPTIYKLGLEKSDCLKKLLWFIITGGRMKIFYIIDGKNVAHYSVILPKNFRFPFMKKGDLQIGPCFTYPSHRGIGLYTLALKLIPLLFSKQTDLFWIYTTETNRISQRTIEKAGFGFQGLVKSVGPLRILEMI